MRGAVHCVAIHLCALLSLGIGAACSTTVDVVVDEREDFSRYRTWDFYSRAHPKVDAPYGDPRALDARVARLVEQELQQRGFERNASRPDFLVSYHLALRRRVVVIEEPAAPYLLSSHTSSASYWIEGTSRNVSQVHEDLRLAIGLSDGSGRRRTWRGVLLRTVVDASVLPLDDAVATLLDRLPSPDPRDVTDAVAAGSR
jgi:hypothetical protein